MSIAEKLLTIAENEQRVYDAGYEKGKSEGGDTDAAFEAGRQAELKRVWDIFQRNGARTAYAYAFGYGNFTSETFYPKYDINFVGDTSNAFYNFSFGEPFSLTERLNECGVTLDTSQSILVGGLFSWASVFTEIPTIDLRGLTSRNASRASYLFNQCANLVTIEKIIIEEDIIIQNWFVNCTNLENIVIEGTIGKNGFDIHWSTKLSKASILSILKACNKVNAGVTITLPSVCPNLNAEVGADSTITLETILVGAAYDLALTEAWTAAYQKGYTIAYA